MYDVLCYYYYILITVIIQYNYVELCVKNEVIKFNYNNCIGI